MTFPLQYVLRRHRRFCDAAALVGFRGPHFPFCPHQSAVKELSREEAESKLELLGFLVLSTPLKRDTATNISRLVKSSHFVVMITGTQRSYWVQRAVLPPPPPFPPIASLLCLHGCSGPVAPQATVR